MSSSKSFPNIGGNAKYKTGVSLEPEVARSLDELAARAGVNRSWVLNAIVREYLRLTPEPALTPLPSREAIIQA